MNSTNICTAKFREKFLGICERGRGKLSERAIVATVACVECIKSSNCLCV